MEPSSKRAGRPVKPAPAGSKASLGLKVTAETKARVEQAATASGRTQSQEAEYRLERSFDQGGFLPDTLALGFGQEMAGLVLMIAHAMERTGRLAAWDATDNLEFWMGDAWLANPSGYDAAVRAAHTILEAFRPPGKVEAPDAPLPYRRGSPPAKASALAAEMINDYLLGSRDKPASAADIRRLLSPETLKRLRSKV